MFSGVFTEGTNLYVCRKSGNDNRLCTLSNPCKTIAWAVNLALSGDHIYLNGAKTDEDPYNCSDEMLRINKSLSFERLGPIPQIRCLNWTIVDESYSDLEVNVTLSGLFFNDTAITFHDSSAGVDGCEFVGRKQSVKFVVTNKTFLSIRVRNSLFWKNASGFSVAVESTEKGIHSHVSFDVKNSIFRDYFVVSGAESGNLINMHSSLSVGCDLTLDNVTFTNNLVSRMGLVYLNLKKGQQNILLKDVVVIGNNHLCPFDDCTEFIIDSYSVRAIIGGTYFSGLSGMAFSVTAARLSAQVYNSSFSACDVNGDGGALLFLATERANISVINSSFVKTAASKWSKGGAVYIQCPNSIVSFHRCVFKDTMAEGGGAVSISAFRPLPVSLENIATEEDRSFFNWNRELHFIVNITDCVFKSAIAYRAPGGAVSIIAPKMLVSLRDSKFLGCSSYGYGGAIFVWSLSQPSQLTESAVLYIVQSHFVESRSDRSQGGAVFVQSERLVKVTIKNSEFLLSSAYNGGALAFAFPMLAMKMKDSLPFGSENYITIESSSFVNSSVPTLGGAIFVDVTGEHQVIIKNSTFVNNSAAGPGGAIASVASGSRDSQVGFESSITIESSQFFNNAAPRGGAIYFDSTIAGYNLTIKNTFFKKNNAGGPGGALYSEMPWDTLEDAGCIVKDCPSVKKFPKWEYITNLLFMDTTFKHNTALIGGALYLHRGKATFQHCSFLDNFASAVGGTIYAAERSTSVAIRDSFFLQSKTELIRNSRTFSKSSFIHTESTGPLLVENTTINARRNAVGNSLVMVGKGGIVDFGHDNFTQLYCPVGSKMQYLNFSNTITTGTNNVSCTIQVTGLGYSCLPCTGGLYSLQRGQVHGTHLKSGFECLICPFGADCSKNIVAKQNFWGFEESHLPPSLKFTICPPGYCGPNEQRDSLDYNSCHGNRSGVLCGQCKSGFTETLYSTCCRPVSKCTDYWFWPVAAVYVLVVALYLTFKPPFLNCLKRQIFWFKEPTPANQEPDFDRGYLKIVFYFYQAGNLLLVSSSSEALMKTYFVEPVVGLFNFQEKLSSSCWSICPFPGFTVVTKRLFSTLHVFGTLVMICLLFCLHVGLQKIRGRDAPLAGPYLGGILQVLLLGYVILGSVSFDLLRCVSISSEWRLFYDGNVVCYQWWQYVLIAFIVTFIIPFGFVLFWGALKLHREVISVKRFLLACIFPAPFLIHWILTALLGNSNNGNVPCSLVLTPSIEKVLYDPFKRPEDGKGGSLNWESVLIGRRLVLITMKAVISDPFSRLMLMTFFSFLVLLHHSAKKPFRDSKANTVETVSLLSLIVLGMVNLFPASFHSLAVTSTSPFADWLNVCSWVELLILGVVPALFALLVVVFIISQACRLFFHVCRFVYRFCGLCRAIGCCRFGNRDAELLTPVT